MAILDDTIYILGTFQAAVQRGRPLAFKHLEPQQVEQAFGIAAS
jgi:hypothetical protein